MTNPVPLGDEGQESRKLPKGRIPKVSRAERSLRQAVLNPMTHLIADMTTATMNTSKNEIRSTFSVKNPWLGMKEEMPNFLSYIPKYLIKNPDTKTCSEVLIKVYEEGIDLFAQMPPVEEDPGTPISGPPR